MLSVGSRCHSVRRQCHRTAPSFLQMTCGRALAPVVSPGGIVLATGGYTYDRFVAHRGLLPQERGSQTVWVPTRDTPNCHLWRWKEADPIDRQPL